VYHCRARSPCFRGWHGDDLVHFARRPAARPHHRRRVPQARRAGPLEGDRLRLARGRPRLDAGCTVPRSCALDRQTEASPPGGSGRGRIAGSGGRGRFHRTAPAPRDRRQRAAGRTCGGCCHVRHPEGARRRLPAAGGGAVVVALFANPRRDGCTGKGRGGRPARSSASSAVRLRCFGSARCAGQQRGPLTAGREAPLFRVPAGRTAAAGEEALRPDAPGGGKSGLQGSTVAANGRRGRPQGKCHRDETARAGRPARARVKRCGKSAPRLWQQGRHGKPHREQDRIGAARAREVTFATSRDPGRRPGWLHEAGSDPSPR
jgi:hypothetical protein